MSMTPAEKAILHRALDLEDVLVEFAGPATRPLVNQLSDIRGEAVADAEDRILRLCGAVLVEHGLEDLFDAIYARTIDAPVEPGRARRFLFNEIQP